MRQAIGPRRASTRSRGVHRAAPAEASRPTCRPRARGVLCPHRTSREDASPFAARRPCRRPRESRRRAPRAPPSRACPTRRSRSSPTSTRAPTSATSRPWSRRRARTSRSARRPWRGRRSSSTSTRRRSRTGRRIARTAGGASPPARASCRRGRAACARGRRRPSRRPSRRRSASSAARGSSASRSSSSPGRPPELREATERNLREQGYEWDGVVLQPAGATFASAVDFKAPERKKIAEQGYTILLSMGDQQSDLDGGYAERTFKLPNPVYFLP